MGTPLAVIGAGCPALNIMFNTTLTSEDENRIAPALLRTLASILDLLPSLTEFASTTNADLSDHRPSEPREEPLQQGNLASSWSCDSVRRVNCRISCHF